MIIGRDDSKYILTMVSALTVKVSLNLSEDGWMNDGFRSVIYLFLSNLGCIRLRTDGEFSCFIVITLDVPFFPHNNKRGSAAKFRLADFSRQVQQP